MKKINYTAIGTAAALCVGLGAMLIGGKIAFQNFHPFSTLRLSIREDGGRGANAKSAGYMGGGNTTYTKQLADLERNLISAQKSGEIHPGTYRDIEKKLAALEKKGVNTKKARALLQRLRVGGQQPQNAGLPKAVPLVKGTSKNTDIDTASFVERNINAGIQNGGISPAGYQDLVRKLNALEAKGIDISRLRTLLKKLRVGGVESRPDCVSNPTPVFAYALTDIDKIESIITPPSLVKGDLKTHSYINTNHARVPVYAPVDMVLDSVSYFTGGPYGMVFEASCEIKIGFGHITEPSAKIMAHMPKDPATTTLGTAKIITAEIKFKAGELLAYTTGTDLAGNWDFGVYNVSAKNRYAGNPAYASSWKHTGGVCPFDYFTPELRVSYTKLFATDRGNALPDGESFCR